jgi:hypothetical protein
MAANFAPLPELLKKAKADGRRRLIIDDRPDLVVEDPLVQRHRLSFDQGQVFDGELGERVVPSSGRVSFEPAPHALREICGDVHCLALEALKL